MSTPQDRGTLHARPGFRRPFKAKPKGHDGYLADLQETGAIVTFSMMSDGSTVTGKIIARDKFTISIQEQIHKDGVPEFDKVPRVIYKHGIEQFKMLAQGDSKAPSSV